MERKAEVLIVGGGIMGLCIAYYASKMGIRGITIIDRGKVGRGASTRNSSVLRETYAEEWMIRICQRGITLWEGLSGELNWNLLFDQKGHLSVLREEGHLQSAIKAVLLQNSFGVRSSILQPDEVFSIIPFARREGILGAVYHKRGGSIHHDATIFAFEKAVRKIGVEIIEGLECERLEVSGGKVTGAKTSAGEVKAPKVIVAASNNTVSLCRQLGVDLPIKTFQREAMVTEPYKRFLKPVVNDRSTGLLLNQTLRGEIVIDHNQEEVQDWNGLDATLWFARAVSNDICELFPPLQHVRIIRQWSGDYDLTPDRGPILGDVGAAEGLHVCSGFSGHGLMMAPAVGELFGELLAKGVPPPLMKRFDLARFAAPAAARK